MTLNILHTEKMPRCADRELSLGELRLPNAIFPSSFALHARQTRHGIKSVRLLPSLRNGTFMGHLRHAAVWALAGMGPTKRFIIGSSGLWKPFINPPNWSQPTVVISLCSLRSLRLNLPESWPKNLPPAQKSPPAKQRKRHRRPNCQGFNPPKNP